MSQAPKKSKKTKKPSKTAPQSKKASAKGPLAGLEFTDAVFLASFTAPRATLAVDWPANPAPGVEVDTYEADAQCHIGTIPIRADSSALTILRECNGKQGPDQNAAIQRWLIVGPKV